VQPVPERFREWNLAQRFRLGPSLRTVDVPNPAHQVRAEALAPVGNQSREARHLQRRHRHFALTDPEIHRVAGVPHRRIPPFSNPCHRGHYSRALSHQVNAGLATQTHEVARGTHRIRAGALGEGAKVGVA